MSISTINNYSLQNMEPGKIDLLKRTFCKGATDDEFELFIHACNRLQLDPFMRQIYAVKRWSEGKETMTMQTGIDGYRLIAERTGKYLPGKECSFTYKDGKVYSATAYVKKLAGDKQWHEIAHTVFWDEYAAKKKDGNLTGMWKDKPHVMLGKCAESGALRKAFPADLSGVYTKEEMEQADVESVETIQPNLTKEELITADEAIEIENLLSSEDKEYRDNLLKHFGHVNGTAAITNFFFLPRKNLQACMKSIQRKRADRLKKDDSQAMKEEALIEEIPF